MKKFLFTIIILNLIFIININAYAEENKGYVQLTAYLDKDVLEEKPDVEVLISDGTEDGESITYYLHAMNDYKSNLTLPEGTYYIEMASVLGDNYNFYPFEIEDMDFQIIKDKPAKMYFKLGVVEDDLPICEDNQEEVKENKDLILDVYDEEGNLDQEKINKAYKDTTGKDLQEDIKEFKEIEEKKEKEEKEYKEKQKEKEKPAILKWISRNILLIIVGILGVVLIFIKHKSSKI